MDSLTKLKCRSTDLLSQVQHGLPAHMARLRRPPDAMAASWERIDVPPVARSSHSLDVVAGAAYIWGGELAPREPVANDMHVVRLPGSGAGADYYRVEAVPAKHDERREAARDDSGAAQDDSDAAQRSLDEVPLVDEVPLAGEVPLVDEAALAGEAAPAKGKGPAAADGPPLADVPAPRVGHATAAIGARIFLFGGRGGPDMAPLDEAGRVWVYDTRAHAWSHLDPVAAAPRPAPRSYHCAAASAHPRDAAAARKPQTWRQWALGDTARTGTPQDPIVGAVAEEAVDHESDGYGTLFVHAGCLAGGRRACDLWAFDVGSRTWSELPAAPGPARGGTAICISKSRLFRFGGYDGQAELGRQLDFLPLRLETSGGAAVDAGPGGWQTMVAGSSDAGPDAETDWPAPRSVASLQALSVGGGREYLVLAMGERSPSADGHAGAGAFLDDVWALQVPPLGTAAAGLKDAVRQAVGRKTGEGRWTRVATRPRDDDGDGGPARRGWLASAPMGDVDESAIVIWGGLGEDNQRLGDGWVLRLDS